MEEARSANALCIGPAGVGSSSRSPLSDWIGGGLRGTMEGAFSTTAPPDGLGKKGGKNFEWEAKAGKEIKTLSSSKKCNVIKSMSFEMFEES